MIIGVNMPFGMIIGQVQYSRPLVPVLWWLDLYLGRVNGHWKNSLKIGHVTNTYIGGMYAFTMNSHDPKGLMRL